MEKLRERLSEEYDLPGAKPDDSVRLGIPKDHPQNPFYPGGKYYHYSCSFEQYVVLNSHIFIEDHWDYRGESRKLFNRSINPHKDSKNVINIGLCLPMFQRDFPANLMIRLSPEIFDDLQPLRGLHNSFFLFFS